MNYTGDSAQDYLADGLTEETIAQLARLRPAQLGVIARTSVMRYKHGDWQIDQIGRELAIGYAYAQRDQGLQEVKTIPLLNGIRRDPRYAAFLVKMRLP